MRISDWSSDVCSSDLLGDEGAVAAHASGGDHGLLLAEQVGEDAGEHHRHFGIAVGDPEMRLHRTRFAPERIGRDHAAEAETGFARSDGGAGAAARSEAHTSELQSIMRTSYAVSCLK